MKVGVVGVGEMGLAMAGHILDHDIEVAVFDVNQEKLGKARERGLATKESLTELAQAADVFILVVATDQQVIDVSQELAEKAADGAIIVVAATISPETMLQLGPQIEARGKRLVDAPVVYGASGAREGTLLSLCGGSEEDIERIRPVLMSYSRDLIHVGPRGAGQIAKSCNNLLHWVHCVANFETLADRQALRDRCTANARSPPAMPGNQRHPQPVGQHALHLAGKGYGCDAGPGPEGRPDAAAFRTSRPDHQDVARR